MPFTTLKLRQNRCRRRRARNAHGLRNASPAPSLRQAYLPSHPPPFPASHELTTNHTPVHSAFTSTLGIKIVFTASGQGTALRVTISIPPISPSKNRAAYLGSPRILPRSREHDGAPLVRLRHGVVLHRGTAVLALHGRVPVYAELRHETLQNPEKAALVKEVRRRQGDEALRPERSPLCNDNESVSVLVLGIGIIISIGIGIGIDICYRYRYSASV